MAEFINTIDLLGDEVVFASVVDRSITEFKDDSVTQIGTYAFGYCRSLISIDFPNVRTVSAFAFYSCKALPVVNLPNVTTIEQSAFYGCTSLTTVDFSNLDEVYSNAFSYCTVLSTVILRSSKVCSEFANNVFSNTELSKGNGYIYVPRDLVDSYKQKLTTYANQFRALEDYTVDGTTTGELDPKKVDPLTWTKVQTFIANGTYKDNLAIGDTLPLDLGSEGVIDMEIVAFDTDDKADGSGKAPITWIAKELLATTQKMDPDRTSSSIADWPTEPLYTYLQNTIKPLIPEEVRNAIVPVTKKYYYFSYSKSLKTSSDDIWIPSMAEMCGVEEDGYYYSEAYPNDSSRIKLLSGKTYGGTYWTRSPSAKSNFYYIWGKDGTYISNGEYMSGQSNSALNIALGFCM